MHTVLLLQTYNMYGRLFFLDQYHKYLQDTLVAAYFMLTHWAFHVQNNQEASNTYIADILSLRVFILSKPVDSVTSR